MKTPETGSPLCFEWDVDYGKLGRCFKSVLALSFQVSQLRGIGLSWFVPIGDTFSSQCSSWEVQPLPPLTCQVLSDKIYRVVKCSLLNPYNDPAAMPDSTFFDECALPGDGWIQRESKGFLLWGNIWVSCWNTPQYRIGTHPNLTLHRVRSSSPSLLLQQGCLFLMPPFLSNRCLGREEEEKEKGEKEGKLPMLRDSGVTFVKQVKCQWECLSGRKIWGSI